MRLYPTSATRHTGGARRLLMMKPGTGPPLGGSSRLWRAGALPGLRERRRSGGGGPRPRGAARGSPGMWRMGAGAGSCMNRGARMLAARSRSDRGW